MKYSRVFAIATIALLAITSAIADGGAQHRQETDQLGVSGGNVNDISSIYCCSGTLGALMQDSTGTRYILSNNHVLARSDQGTVGDDVSQPGRIDLGCQPGRIVGELVNWPRLGSNVDAAVAVSNGEMRDDGFIMDVGVPSSNAIVPTVGMQVAKSGRTTGYTQATVGAINATITVQYQRGCGVGRKFTVTYTNQVVINSSAFSAGGDSGSLIVSGHTGAACRQPAALLYAGSSTTTIGNPAAEVRHKLGQALNTTLTFAGGTCGTDATFDGGSGDGGGNGGGKGNGKPPKEGMIPAAEIARARAAKNSAVSALMSDPAVMGVGVGASDVPGRAAVIVYVEQGRPHHPLPKNLDGVPVQVIYSDVIRAFGWNEKEGEPRSCSVK